MDDELFVQIGPNAERAPLMRIKPEIDVVLEGRFPDSEVRTVTWRTYWISLVQQSAALTCLIGSLCWSGLCPRAMALQEVLRERALSIIGWVSAFLLANIAADAVSDLARNLIDEPTTRYLLGWALTFIAVLMIFGVIAAFLSKQMRQPGFNVGNRLLGGIFGLLLGGDHCRGNQYPAARGAARFQRGLAGRGSADGACRMGRRWIGANFDRVLESEPTEAVKDTIDSRKML